MIHCGGPGLVNSSTRILPLRLFVAATLMLVLGAGVVLADRKERKANKPKKGRAYHGVIQTIDPSAGTLTLALRKTRRHPEVRTRQFTIGQTARFVIFSAGDQKEELIGKEGLSNTNLKQGTSVTVLTDHDNHVMVVEVGQHKHAKNPKPAKEPQPPGASNLKQSKSDSKESK